MAQTELNRAVEGGAGISWMIHAAKGTPDSGEVFNAAEINMVRDLFDRAYSENGYDLIRDLKYRIREGERSAYELSQVRPDIDLSSDFIVTFSKSFRYNCGWLDTVFSKLSFNVFLPIFTFF